MPFDRSPVRALIWKEWHEMRDRVVLMAAVAVATSSLVVVSSRDDWGGTLLVLNVVIAVAGAVYFGLRVAAGERGQRTESLLRGLPARRSRVATVRFVVGLAGPLLVAVAAVVPAFGLGALLGRPPEGLPAQPFDLTAVLSAIAILALLGVPIYLWTVAAGLSAGSESAALLRVVLLGLGLAVIFGVVLAGVALFEHNAPGHSSARDRAYWVFTLLGGCSPLGPLVTFMSGYDAHRNELLLPLVVGSVVSVVGLSAWCIARMHTPPAPIRKRTYSDAVRRPLGPPLTRRWVSLLRINLGVPLASAGAVLALLLLALGASWLRHGPHSTYPGSGSGNHLYLWLWAALIHAGLMAALLFGQETDREQPWFWRSRPIRIHRWFAVRAATGLVLLLVVHLTPALLDLMLGWSTADSFVWNSESDSLRWVSEADPTAHRTIYRNELEIFGDVVWPAVWILPLASAACFSVVVVAIAWIRNAIIVLPAAFFAVLLLLALPNMGDVWGWLPGWNPFMLMFPWYSPNDGYPWFVGLCLLLTSVSLVLAARSFRRRVA